MAKYTGSKKDIRYLARINKKYWDALTGGFILKIEKTDGSVVEGYNPGCKSGNNGNINDMKYFQELILFTLDSREHIIDMLDIKKITNITSSINLIEYNAMGIIPIIDE